MTQPALPKGQKRLRSRAAIIAAATEVVARRGIMAATLDEIAKRAGMTKGAIYSNFASKDDLVLAVLDARQMTFVPDLASGASAEALLQGMGRALLARLDEIRADGRFIAELQFYAVQSPELGRRLADRYSQSFTMIADQIVMHYGGTLPMPPRSLVVAVQCLALGFIYQALMTPDEVDEAAVMGAFTALARGLSRP
ncbi:MAG TPA: helix-turn-helix domain-containing protein [Asticcacaulis sp.]|nr:helix-turn-helix domain-containing protein [Asticcacaulis sp.]